MMSRDDALLIYLEVINCRLEILYGYDHLSLPCYWRWSVDDRECSVPWVRSPIWHLSWIGGKNMIILPLKKYAMSMTKLSVIKVIIRKSKLTLNQIRIHNDGSEKGKPVRSLLTEIKYNKIISMEDWTMWIWITFKESPKWWVLMFKWTQCWFLLCLTEVLPILSFLPTW